MTARRRQRITAPSLTALHGSVPDAIAYKALTYLDEPMRHVVAQFRERYDL